MPPPNLSQVVAAVAAAQKKDGYAMYAGLAARFGLAPASIHGLVRRLAARGRLNVSAKRPSRITVADSTGRKA